MSYARPKGTKIYISNPTWPNHMHVFKTSGLTNQAFYPYYDSAHNSFDFKGMTETIWNAEPGSIVLLHGCAHNPTGIDPTKDQWNEIADICEKKSLIPFISVRLTFC